MGKDETSYELAKVNAEVNKLRVECRAKPELSDDLRMAHVEQEVKICQAKLEIEKLAQELNAKSEEIHDIRQMYEDLQSSLHREEMLLQQISIATQKLQAENREELLKLESKNRDLSITLDEATARIHDLERKTCATDEEIAALKRILSVKSEKDNEMQRSASKDLKDTDKYILRLEEETRISKVQLKLEREQFSHLEEAHDKLQNQFQASVVEWEKEKSSLIDEVSKLQAALDEQSLISEGVAKQLRICDQPLAHEESRRKFLEIQLSGRRTQFENVFLDCQPAQSEIEQIIIEREEEIIELRNLLKKKDILADEMRCRSVQFEQENGNLLGSFKDMEAAQINNSGVTSSLKKMGDKLHNLEQLHGKCTSNLKEKETEWNYQMEKLKRDLICCLSELDSKNKRTGEIHKELEDCQILLEVKNEEIFALVMVLKSDFYDAFSMMCDEKEKLGMCMKQFEEKNMLLKQQLESKNAELNQVCAELKQRCNEIAALADRVQGLDSLKQSNLNEKELIRHKEMLEESNECQHRSKEQCLKLENILRYRKNSSHALKMSNSHVAKKTSELNCKLDLQRWKTEAETLKLKLEENQHAHKQEHAGLTVILKDQDAKVGKLEEQISVLESIIQTKSEVVEMLEQEKNTNAQNAEQLQNKIAQLRAELVEKEAVFFALMNTNKALEQKNEELSSNIKERDQKIQELQKHVETSDHKLCSTVISFAEKVCMHNKAIKAVEDQKTIEMEEKNEIIYNLEKKVRGLSSEVESQEKELNESKQGTLGFEALLQSKNLEIEELKGQFGNERSSFKGLAEELKKASIGMEDSLSQLESICGRLGVFCKDDLKFMDMLETMLRPWEDKCEKPLDLLPSGGLDDTIFSP